MNTQKATKIIVVASVAALIVWDVYVAATPADGDTISEVVRAWAHAHPAIPFGLGFVCGHWFWSSSKPSGGK